MEKTTLMLPILFMLLVPDFHTHAQNLDSLWRPFAYLAGEWTGEGKGTPGQGSGVSSFSFDLEKHLLVRKSHSSYPAMNGRPASVHDDLMMIYHEEGLGMQALYVDNESHVIHYEVRVSAAGDTLEFLSTQQPGAPRYRLRYVSTGERTADVSFDIAMPNAQGAFKRYISGGIVKK
jgi:hypothetical protein